MSMILAPFLIQMHFKFIQPRFAGTQVKRDADEIDQDERDNPVIVAGFGRFGQMVTRLLRACGIKATVLDYDIEQIEVLRRFDMKAFYGDASEMDLLRAAGAQKAKLLILAIDDPEKALKIIDLVHNEFPNLKIIARTYDRIHAYQMIHKGITTPYIETAGSALNLGIDALQNLGFSPQKATRAAQIFKTHNDKSIQELAKVYCDSDEATYVTQVKNWLSALEGTLQSDQGEEVVTETNQTSP